MTGINWQQQPPERAGIFTCDGYEVRWYFEGGTWRKKWQAMNPSGEVRQGYLTKLAAMALCEIGIKKAREKAMIESGEMAEIKAAGRAQIAAMKEMMR